MQKTIIVIPCYNEAGRLKEEEFILLSRQPDLGLLFVNDGSQDNTEQLLKDIIEKTGNSVQLLSLEKNQGKAEAVRCGMLQAISQGADITGFIDADMATPTQEVLRLLEEAKKNEHAVILGSRVKLLGAEITRRPIRHYIGRIFATFASLVLRLSVYDTQCGAKLFYASSALKDALAEPFQSRWIFDVELIGRLLIGSETSKSLKEKDFIEIPLKVWKDVQGSKIMPIDFLKAAKELFQLAIDLELRRKKLLR